MGLEEWRGIRHEFQKDPHGCWVAIRAQGAQVAGRGHDKCGTRSDGMGTGGPGGGAGKW